ncbi:MAG: glycosyltransferase family 39 protein [Leptolyngbya sp. SIO4C1]|nr:glycosyltransferase family 39 protein [Leptolyngbya sp. SIO4C1]
MVLWLLGGSLLFRGLIAWQLPPGFDEAYYFLYTQHLDWSYFDHPLMVALTSGVGIWLTGHVSPLTLRLGSLLLFTGSTGLLYLTARRLFGAKVGWLTAAIASIAPLFFFSFGLLAAPDSALIFFWSAVLFVAADEFFPVGKPYRPTYRLAVIGVLLGLASLSKYHGFVLGLSLIGFCLASAAYRRALRSPWLAVGLLGYGLTLLPLLVWNAQHEWISFAFHLSKRFDGGRAGGFRLSQLLGVWLAEVGFLFPTIGLPLWWVSLRTLWQRVRPQKREPSRQTLAQAFLLWMGLPIALGFTLLGGFTQIYPAWPAPGLWTLLPLLALTAASWSQTTVRRWLTGTGAFVGALLLFALLHVSLGTLQRPSQYAILGGAIAPEADPTTALIDVVQLRRQLQASPAVSDAIAAADFWVTNEFWLSGYVDMAISPLTAAPVTAFTEDPRGHALWFNPISRLGQRALFLSIADFDQAQIQAEYQPYFSQFTLIDAIALERGGATTETVFVYSVGQLVAPYPYPYP